MSRFEHIFSPIRVGTMELPNRLVMAPMTVDYANDDETPSERQIAYYRERARGGVSLIGLEVCSVDSDHRYQQHSLGLHSDEQIAGHKKLVDAIHAEGALVQPQISHPGPESLAPFFKQIQPMGPSVIRTETTGQNCREMSVEDIQHVTELYGDACLRAQEAGYDGIELHAAHSYMMLGSFLSPLRNFRTDDYAGRQFMGRARLLLEVLANVRGKVGRDFPITLRISGFERESGGREISDTQRLAPLLVEAGVDCFHVSGGVGDSNTTQIITGPDFTPGYNVVAATAIKQVVDVPVMAVGQNMDPAFIESLIEEDRVDMVAMARALLADPDFPKKLQAGRQKEINRCHLCQGCVDIMTSEFNGAGCVINPRAGKEESFPLESARKSKKVLVIGGGPSGLASAIYASHRGHQVTLMEKGSELGGVFRLASMLFPNNQILLESLQSQIEALPIEVKLNHEATQESIRQINPDSIIVATGGIFKSPHIEGEEADHVIRGSRLIQWLDRARSGDSSQDRALGKKVVVIGAELIGLELAGYLAKKGHRVHIVEPSGRMAMPAGQKRRGVHAIQLDRLGVPINTGVGVQKITEEGVLLELDSGFQKLLKADSVFVIGHPEANPEASRPFEEMAPEVRTVGDATGFGLCKKAFSDALTTVYEI
ncbi:MAG: FAD-dependent oxidoreductase [Myxococcota bacterium]